MPKQIVQETAQMSILQWILFGHMEILMKVSPKRILKVEIKLIYHLILWILTGISFMGQIIRVSDKWKNSIIAWIRLTQWIQIDLNKIINKK